MSPFGSGGAQILVLFMLILSDTDTEPGGGLATFQPTNALVSY